ncbi:tap domain-containing protein [Actinoplanes friuliensis DSM 7358]|uniref:Tap domain-containing protein n=2 Tax=Actinoplanes friuliensis TaxID=196914 RepID=U5VZ13_9ACTN|nr:tap domain-containing protein [Actinoplanes friuliensis DSM 7358]
MVLVTVAAGVTAVAPPASARPAPIDWRPCAADKDAQCADLTLPVDWSEPSGATFTLAVARRAAPESTRIGTLIFGPGGPGDSGVRRVVTGQSRFSDELRSRFDIVSFDPRGVGGSNPIKCPTKVPAPAVLKDQAEFDATRKANREFWDACRVLTGPVFDHADTGSTVRDLDALRAALGERSLTFHGSSYGTLLGELYAERYPGRVRAMVLESVVDHSQDTRGFLTTQAWALQDSFDAFVAWCDTTEACVLHGEDVRSIWAQQMARADDGTLGVSAFELAANAHDALRKPNYPALATFIDGLRDGGTASPASQRPVQAVFCADWSLPVRNYREYQRLLRAAAAEAPDVRLPAATFGLSDCLGWPKPVASPQHVLHVRTRTPLLLINARHDPATGYNWATEVARQLGRHGVLLTYAGAGHGSYGSTCMRSAVDAYLISAALPAPGTVCPAA